MNSPNVLGNSREIGATFSIPLCYFVVCNTEFLKTFYDIKKQVCVLHTECTEQLVEFLRYNLHIPWQRNRVYL